MGRAAIALAAAMLTGCAEAPWNYSNGVTHGRIGEDVIGLSRSQLVKRLGDPMVLPAAARPNCLYYLSPGGGQAFGWDFCFRHGRVHSAAGHPICSNDAPYSARLVARGG